MQTVSGYAYSYYLDGNQSEKRENDGTITAYGYDKNGNRSSLVYANCITTEYAYNDANLITSLNNKKGMQTVSGYAYSYYSDIRIKKEQANPKGRTIHAAFGQRL